MVQDAQLAAKRTLRADMRARRASMPDAARQQLSEAACRNLCALEAWREARVIAGYRTVDGEIDPGFALGEATTQGKIVAFPRITDLLPRLRFHQVEDVADFRPGAFGIDEPTDACPEMAAERVGLFVVPGLAFDRTGARLGFGGGYYDELAAHLAALAAVDPIGPIGPIGPRGVLVGFAYSFQLVEQVPRTEADRGVDFIVTDRQIIACVRPQPG